jgi:peptidoglycan/LPS O-acetylase OafA/YrhL
MNRSLETLQAKSHYLILDGLRGVAAILVVIFHLFETYSGGDHTKQILNHGYLAVDFFFLLSGFVIAYAYDDRWDKMSYGEFCKRRLIRLQPMVIVGSVIGAALFYLQTGPVFPTIATTPLWRVLLVMLIGCTLLPLPPSMDLRGWQEMHPLNGPAWSLFYEYIGNILYATVIRRLSNKVLGLAVLLAALFLIHLGITSPHGDVIGGWSITRAELHVGFARLLFPFLAGMLLMRLGKRIHVRGGFLVCSLLVACALCMPRVGGTQHLWWNGVYDSFAIILIFPLIVAMGAGSRIDGSLQKKLCKFCGDISYPLYITHYPLIYIYTAWVVRDKVPAGRGAIAGAGLLIAAVAIAYGCVKLYDEPVRKWLAQRFLHRAKQTESTQAQA